MVAQGPRSIQDLAMVAQGPRALQATGKGQMTPAQKRAMQLQVNVYRDAETFQSSKVLSQGLIGVVRGASSNSSLAFQYY